MAKTTDKPETNPHTMTIHGYPLDVLKAGLSKLKKGVEKRRTHLLGCLQRGEKISEEDEAWLDNDANHVNEEAVIGMLEGASNFECSLAWLNLEQKKVVERLRELGSGNTKGNNVGNKRKRCNEMKMKGEAQEKKVKSNLVFTKKENASLVQCIEILDWHHESNEQNQSNTAQHWDQIYPNLQLKQPTISAWLKDESKW
ncbi:hypothetical protein BC827DRAFT_1158422 [Russula dissimulans]|nr:hypothetical protein BC827DRAFT_1158422 [Russula dissimulans]